MLWPLLPCVSLACGSVLCWSLEHRHPRVAERAARSIEVLKLVYAKCRTKMSIWLTLVSKRIYGTNQAQ